MKNFKNALAWRSADEALNLRCLKITAMIKQKVLTIRTDRQPSSALPGKPKRRTNGAIGKKSRGDSQKYSTSVTLDSSHNPSVKNISARQQSIKHQFFGGTDQ